MDRLGKKPCETRSLVSLTLAALILGGVVGASAKNEVAIGKCTTAEADDMKRCEALADIPWKYAKCVAAAATRMDACMAKAQAAPPRSVNTGGSTVGVKKPNPVGTQPTKATNAPVGGSTGPTVPSKPGGASALTSHGPLEGGSTGSALGVSNKVKNSTTTNAK
jgi:hypothetical protein